MTTPSPRPAPSSYRERLGVLLLDFDESKVERDEAGRFSGGGGGGVSVGGRDITVTLPERAKRAGDVLVNIDIGKFDPEFQQEQGFYLEPGGKGGIGNRYQRFEEFLSKNDSIEAPEVSVQPNGRVGFTNGRHRYAVLRDRGVKALPVAMTKESAKLAKQHGLVQASYREKLALLLDWDESQVERDDAGKFASAGGGGAAAPAGEHTVTGMRGGKYDPSTLTQHEKAIFDSTRSMAVTAAAVETAKAFGFPPEKLKAEDMKKYGAFKRGGQVFYARGLYDPRSGVASFDQNMNASEATAVLAHEFSHDAFNAASTGDSQEAKDFQEHVSVFASDLRKDDGVTPYSQMYWQHAEASQTATQRVQRTELAVNETLAEISRLKVGGGHVSLETTAGPVSPKGGTIQVMPAPEVGSRIRSSTETKTHRGKAISETWEEAHSLMLKASDKARGK